MFANFVSLSSSPTATLETKFGLAVDMNFISYDVDNWIASDTDQIFALCDFIGPGGFPCFLSKEDALTSAELVKEAHGTEFMLERRQREGVEYWLLD